MRGGAPVKRSARFVDDYLAALLNQAGHVISAEFHAVARETGVSVAEWRILACLVGGEPVPVGQLAQWVLAPQPTVTRQLDRMQRKGWVERSADPSDRRLTLALITPAGQALAAQLVQQARQHEQRVLAPFGKQRAAALKLALRELIDQHSGGR